MMLVPTLGVDLAWHTHQMLPIRYKEECLALVGRFVNHDDSVEDTKLEASMRHTTQLWEDAYGESALPLDRKNKRDRACSEVTIAGWVLLVAIMSLACVCIMFKTALGKPVSAVRRGLQVGSGSSDWSESWSSVFDDQSDQQPPAELWIVALPLCAAIMICGFCLVNWGCCDWRSSSDYEAGKNARSHGPPDVARRRIVAGERHRVDEHYRVRGGGCGGCGG